MKRIFASIILSTLLVFNANICALAATKKANPVVKITNSVGRGIAWTAKGIGKSIFWTGKGIYKVAEFFVVETFRPIKAITNKIIDVWGVPVEE